MKASLSSNSLKAYNKNLAQFQQFVYSLPMQYRGGFPNAGQLTLFIAFLFDHGLSAATITSKLSPIAYYCKLMGLEDCTQNFICQKALTGVRKILPSADLRFPMTVPILEKLIANTSHVTDCHYESLLLKSMLSLSFYALLRPGEVTNSIHNLYVHSLELFHDHLEVKFYRFKHRSGPPITIHVASQSNTTCPVMLLKAYIVQRKRNPGPLFCFHSGKPVTYRRFSDWFQNLLLFCNVAGTFNLHSFRIGGATLAASKGLTSTQIQQLGRWQSSAYSGYIRLPNITI